MAKKRLTSLEIFVLTKAVIPTARQWCKGTLETDGNRHCLMGALEVAKYGAIRGEIAHLKTEQRILGVCIKELFPGRFTGSVVDFNDHSRTTHADVIKILDRVIEIKSKGKIK